VNLGARTEFKLILAILFTAAALWLSFRRVDWPALRDSFRHVRYIWIVLAVANTFIGVFALGLRWRILLKPKADVPLRMLFRLNILSQYANIVAPARIGEIVRVYLASRERTLPAAFVLGTLAVEKLLDFFVFVCLWLTVPVLISLKAAVPGYGTALLFFCLAAAGLFAFLIFRPDKIVRLGCLISRIAPAGLRPKIHSWLDQGTEAFGVLRRPGVLLAIILWTVFLILNQVLTNFLVFFAFGLSLPFAAALLALLAIQAGAVPPSAPGKIGVFEYAVILALSAFAVPASPALAAAVMLHLVIYLPKILLGFFYLSTSGISLKMRSS